jgi:hypothetical protein
MFDAKDVAEIETIVRTTTLNVSAGTERSWQTCGSAAPPGGPAFFSHNLRDGFARRVGRQGERVYAPAEFISQNLIDYPMTRDARHSGKFLRDDQHSKMALAGAWR